MINKNIKDLIIKYWKIGLIVLGSFLFIGSFIVLYFFGNQNKNQEKVEIQTIINEEVEDKTNNEIINRITIDIKGAIKKPGVYTIESDKRVIDAIELAGGLLESADNSVINLSKKLKDEMVIIIYTKDEIKEMLQGDTSVKIIEKECICPKLENDACVDDNKVTNATDNESSYPIYINSADIEELMKLPGIGESKAKSIIEYREKNGLFEKIEDITNVSGIGESMFEKIKEYIAI